MLMMVMTMIVAMMMLMVMMMVMLMLIMTMVMVKMVITIIMMVMMIMILENSDPFPGKPPQSWCTSRMENCIAQNQSIYCPKAIQISHRNAKFGNQLYLDAIFAKSRRGRFPDQIILPPLSFHRWLENSLNKGFYPFALLNVINAGCAKSIWRVSGLSRTRAGLLSRGKVTDFRAPGLNSAGK